MIFEDVPADVRTEMIELGRHYGSDDTLALGQSMLLHLNEWAEKLADYGLSLEDSQGIRDCVQRLKDLGVGRDAADSDRKQTSVDWRDAHKRGKKVRIQARNILVASERAVRRSKAGDSEEVRALILKALDSSHLYGVDAETLLRQLRALHVCLATEAVSAVAKPRGGDRVSAELTAAISDLESTNATHPGKPGTPVQTEEIDLIDGFLVDLGRTARRAARDCSNNEGLEALTKLFTLDALYHRPSTSPKDAPAETPPN